MCASSYIRIIHLVRFLHGVLHLFSPFLRLFAFNCPLPSLSPSLSPSRALVSKRVHAHADAAKSMCVGLLAQKARPLLPVQALQFESFLTPSYKSPRWPKTLCPGLACCWLWVVGHRRETQPTAKLCIPADTCTCMGQVGRPGGELSSFPQPRWTNRKFRERPKRAHDSDSVHATLLIVA